MNPDNENRLEQNVDRAVQALKSLPVPQGPPPDVVEAVLAADTGRAAGHEGATPILLTLRKRIASMNRFAKLAAAFAAAAVIISASLVAFLVWPGDHPAIAEMLKPITAKTARFKVSVKMEPAPAGAPVQQAMQVQCMESVMRQEMPGGVYQVMDLKTFRTVVFMPSLKKVMIMKMSGMPTEAKDKMSNDFLGEIRKKVEELRASDPKDIEVLPDNTVSGHLAHGFHKRMEGIDLTIWADVKTGLPVLMEIRYGGETQHFTVTMSDFELGVPLDPALFSMDVPAGYTVEERSMDISPPTEADFIEGLRQCAEWSPGKAFPNRIDMDTFMESMKKWAAENSSSGSAQPTPSQEQLNTMMKVQRTLMFVMKLSADKVDWRYAGRGVNLGAGSVPIFWYLPKGAEQYRVIYGDLKVADMAASALPNSPDAQRPDDGSAAKPAPAKVN
jgi:hypothetical protein